MKPKSESPDYSESPFFKQEEYGEGTRMVVWAEDVSRIRDLLAAIIDGYPDRVEILYKVATGDDGWRYHHGEIGKAPIRELLQSNNKWILQDGESQFCVRRPDSGEYIALDDHGILFIYFDDEGAIRRLISDKGFEERDAVLITDVGHWHYIPGEETERNRFISDLGIQEVGTS